jgi:hypothetical protein
MCGIAFIKKFQSWQQPLLSTLSHSPISPPHFAMADLPVYDGAIGIDLGKIITNGCSMLDLLTFFFFFCLGTTYSCVANYEGTNVEISAFSR